MTTVGKIETRTVAKREEIITARNETKAVAGRSILYRITLSDGVTLTCIDPTGDTPEQAIKGFNNQFIQHGGVAKVEY